MNFPAGNSINILVVEDDESLGFLLRENLQTKDVKITIVSSESQSISAFVNELYDICIIDTTLPNEDVHEVAETVRMQYPGVPFIFLITKSQDITIFKRFEIQEENYLLKPFSFKELFTRMQIILRRQNKLSSLDPKGILSFGNLTLNVLERTLYIADKGRRLSQRESELLQLLLQHKGDYLSRGDILKQLWGRDDHFTAKSMDVFMTRIRKLIKDEPMLEIENQYGIGYRIKMRAD